MKILQVGKYYPPDHFGGIETVTQILHEQCQSAVEHDVLAFGSENKVEQLSPGRTVYWCREQLKLSSMPVSIYFFLRWMKLRKNYDVFHFHHPSPFAGVLLLLFPWSGKLVVHWHADIMGKGLKGALYGPFLRKLLSKSDAVVATTEAYANASADLKPFSHKVCVIPLGIESSVDDFRSGKRMPEGFSLLAVGRLVPYKGFDDLISAISKLDDRYSLTIVGQGSERDKLQSQIEVLGLSGRVILAGRVEWQDLDALYRGSSVYCMSSNSRAEAFGVVLLEALRCGLPIVSTNIEGSGVPWVNADKVTGSVVPVGDVEAFASAVKGLCESSDYHAYSQRCVDRFQSLFSAQKMSESFDKLYIGLCD